LTAALPILTFHIIDDGSSPLCFPANQFERAMARLAENGYRTLRLSDAAEMLRFNRPMPPRSIVITFDDGDLSAYERAWPVLRQYNMTATIFVLPAQTHFMQRPLVSWPQIQEMNRAGIDIGAHTLTHPDLKTLSDDRIESEVRCSKVAIEEILGPGTVSCFAYPYGRYDSRSRRIASQHFACSCSDALGLVGRRPDLHALRRVDAYYLRQERLFDLIFSRRFPWYLRARDIPRRIRRAIVRHRPAGDALP
jgi:peptidoglycan/xylan/chitin deacetylase (PgdA/CDA1 family)